MKNDGYSIDFLVIFAFLLCLAFLSMDIYGSYFNFFVAHGLSQSQVNKFLIRLYELAPIFQNSIAVRFMCLLMLFGTSMAFDVKMKVEEGNKPQHHVAMFLISALAFTLVPMLKLGFWPYFAITLSSFVGFEWTFLLLRRQFSFLEKDNEFNEDNQIFKQGKKVMKNPYSVNFKTDKGTINVVNPFRGTMVLGTPGSGKSYSVIEEYIRQHIQKQFAMMVYDFKFPSLAKEAYGFFQYYKKNYKVEPNFSVISLDDIERSNFVNPISPDLIRKAADAIEASQTVLYNLNKEWITKKDFFAQSAISYFASCIYYLKIYEEGKYCTLPHAIALASCTDEKVFRIFSTYKELKFFMTPFADALEKQAYEQLSGQTASARIPLSQLATKELFWVMGNNVYPKLNVPLTINDPENPTVMILANSPSTQTTNSPALGLIATQLLKEVNAQGRQPCSIILDELPTMYFMGLDNLIATARSNKISTTLGMQDLEQLKRDYGDKVAATIFNIVGNIFSGAVRSETASKLQEIFGKKKQKLKNLTEETNKSYTLNQSLEYVIPVSVISQLSQGEFVGVVSDNFGEEIERKIFRGRIKVEKRHDRVKSDIPSVLGDVKDIEQLLQGNYSRIVDEVDNLVAEELMRIERQYDNVPDADD